MSDYDLAIIGGGLTGLSLAAALAPLPLNILMVESRPPVTTPNDLDERSLALGFGSRLIYGGIGIWDQIASSATTIETVHVSQQGYLGSTRLTAKAAGAVALGYVVTLRSLAEALENQVSQQYNLTRLDATRLVAVDLDNGIASLTLQNESGQQQTVTTSLLVGADGGASSSRQLLGIDADAIDYGQKAIVANVIPAKPHDGVAFERFSKAGPLAMLPLQENRCALVWSQPADAADKTMQLDDAEFMAAIERHFGFRLGRIVATGKRDLFPLRMTLASRLTQRRSLLLGNAAHALHPIAGQGLNLALRDVATLAELLQDFDDPGDEMLLQIYERRRRPDINATAKYSDALLRIFDNPWPPLAHGRGSALIGLDRFSALKHRLAHLGMGFRKQLQGPLFHGRPLHGKSSDQEALK